MYGIILFLHVAEEKKSCCAYETLIAVVLGFYLVIKSSSPELNVGCGVLTLVFTLDA